MSEIISITQANQFFGYSDMMCGFMAVAMITSSAPIGKPPIKSPGQLQSDALNWYTQYNGSPNSPDGMSLQQLYDLLKQVGWAYSSVSMSAGAIRDQIHQGHPVIIAIDEASVFDFGLNGNPYPWHPYPGEYNHVIVVSGLDPNGNFLVRDSANIQAPNTLRPGPRVYDGNRLKLISATAAIPHFPVGDTRAPKGWTDNGLVLTAHNGHQMTQGFRDHVLAAYPNWDEYNEPQSDAFGVAGGTAQVLDKEILRWTSARGVYSISAGQVVQRLLTLTKGNVNVPNQF